MRYYAQCDRPFVAGDLLCFTSYDESGNDIFVATDLADGDTDVYYPADLGMDAYLEETMRLQGRPAAGPGHRLRRRMATSPACTRR